MLRANIRNRSFDWMGETWKRYIDPYHFLGKSAFDIPWGDKYVPSANIHRKGVDFVLDLAVPGFEKEEIEIIVKDDVLTIKGEKSHSETRLDQKDYILEEFDFDSFERSFKLAPSIVEDQIEAHYKNGVLTLVFAGVLEEERPYQKIEID